MLDRLAFDPLRHPIGCPVLLVHGGADVLISDVAAQAPFALAAGDHGELRTWPDGEHTIYNRGSERDAIVADWLFSERLAAAGPLLPAASRR